MQLSTSHTNLNSGTNRTDLVTLVLSNLGQYWSLLSEVTQTHVLPFHQFQQLNRPSCVLSPNSRRRVMRRIISQAIEVLEVRINALHKLRERVEVASFDADLSQDIASVLAAESEVS